ncbi:MULTISPECIES: GntR family transcriptional regulator [Halomonadaceae]|jgi:DNA-binding GntR family transcriptional regulator|uniref:GntR family transcriptional regulator n=1 Tax=Vreelandella piezotolerans TaxID=2609667 RepID=A0ABQ6XBF4_9GAMM|nr:MULTISPECIES: GntR family transcriptional regulator [Halomonas]KAE8439356.1 GntR family transcriptional regulator [Halomonas piezotolerans]MCG7591183.1 GntR family transcriptional regulator [Halomonas sp. McD50-5]MCG7617153.1 GntR family transcriptional regulator [Halomonas sp. McD50-4]QJA25125.1 GntR family transcriptional regulator [Halomonas piezotolerans]TNH17579.1 GntR family transcriptional regulator [Halomonas sp. BL6]
MTKILQRNLYREVADRIGELIEHGELAPGERISEKQLCERFGVSRTPLREALKVLATEGLIELLPNRGARVVRLTFKKVKDTYDLMAALEGLSGELACQHISDAEIAAIRALHDAMLEHYRHRDLATYFEINQQIHESILAASRNEVLQEMYSNLSQRVKRVRYSKKMTQKFWSQAVQDHENMISALEQRDSKRLGQILRDHLCNKLEVATLAGVIEDDSLSAANA